MFCFEDKSFQKLYICYVEREKKSKISREMCMECRGREGGEKTTPYVLLFKKYVFFFFSLERFINSPSNFLRKPACTSIQRVVPLIKIHRTGKR